VNENTQNRIVEDWTQIPEECLWEEREEWRKHCHKITYPDGNVSG
jgi:hypothetical protein